ncbi:MAG: hypothetical protein AAF772_05855 [Acidobacteriota bacterium]
MRIELGAGIERHDQEEVRSIEAMRDAAQLRALARSDVAAEEMVGDVGRSSESPRFGTISVADRDAELSIQLSEADLTARLGRVDPARIVVGERRVALQLPIDLPNIAGRRVVAVIAHTAMLPHVGCRYSAGSRRWYTG